ncbi:MAG: hypothetical protein HRU12_25405, partial [Phaeodactylibacter sp.]|nr:hypothetical protein [Phaeodactylibacter sp.]
VANGEDFTPANGLAQTTTFRRYVNDGICNSVPAPSVGEWTVTVADTSAPVAVCQDITVQLDETGAASITADQLDNGSADDCELVSLTISQTDFDCGNVGTNPVTLTAEDIGGNTDTCIAKVVIADTIAPVMSCQDITVFLDGNGLEEITPADVDGGSSDACGVDSLSLDLMAFVCADVGANPVVLSIWDANGNVDSCTATVMVMDTIAPQSICQDVAVQLDANGQYTITAAAVNDGSNDACGINEVALDVTTFDCTSVGDNPVELTIEDANGNTANCYATVTVSDTISPSAICQNTLVQLGNDGLGALTVLAVDGGTSDACGIDTLYIDQEIFDCTHVGDQTVTLTAIDANGNMSTCTSTVTVEDNVAPEAFCQDVTLILDGSGQASLTPAEVDNGSSDACGISSSTLDVSAFDCDDIGDNEVILTVTDNNGNSNSCTATVSVQDTIMPIALCQDVTVQLDEDGVGILTAMEVDAGSADVCLDTLLLSETTFGCGNVGTNTVVLSAIDPAGNTATCSATITVEDNVPPIAGCQDVSVELDSMGFAVVLPADVENGSTDACGIGPFMLDQDVFSCDEVGANAVILTVEDENNNSDTCSATVTVTDPIAPLAACQDVTVQLNAVGTGTLAPAEVDGGSSDNCSIASLTLDVTSYDCDDIGPNPVLLTVTDASGNQSVCTALVFVEDNVAPQALCQDVTVQLNASGLGSLTPDQVDLCRERVHRWEQRSGQRACRAGGGSPAQRCLDWYLDCRKKSERFGVGLPPWEELPQAAQDLVRSLLEQQG